MVMCHMLADTTDDLMAMADAIGVDRRWVQNQGKYNEHFDICAAKKMAAVKAGAVRVSQRDIGRLIIKRRKATGAIA
jgi:hypothetical protein